MNLQNYAEQDRIQYIGDILILVGAVIASAVIFNIIGMSIASFIFNIPIEKAISLNLDYSNKQHINALKLDQIITSIGTWMFTAWLFLRIRKTPFNSYIGIRMPGDKSQWGITTVIFVASFFISAFLLFICSKIPFFIDLDQNINNEKSTLILSKMLEMHGPMDLATNLFVVALIPAITEEIFFRGLLQNWITKLTINPHVAIAITSLIFALVHMNPLQFVPMVFLAAVLGYVYYLTKSIFCSMLVHFLNNSLAVVVYYYKDHSNVASSIVNDSYSPNLFLVAGSAVILISAFYLLQQLRNKLYHE